MERFTLRVLVLVLMGTTLGFWAMAHSHVMTSLPPQDVIRPPTRPGPVPEGPIGSTGASGATAATGGGEVLTIKTPIPGPKAPTGAGAASDYFISLDQAKQMWDTKKYGDKDVIFIDAREYI